MRQDSGKDLELLQFQRLVVVIATIYPKSALKDCLSTKNAVFGIRHHSVL